MTHAIFGLPPQIVQDIGWTLIQFLWQGFGLAAVMEIIVSTCRSPIARHNWAFATLVAMIVAPVATFVTLHGQGGFALTSFSAISPGSTLHGETIFIGSMNWIVIAWLTGIATLSIRALGGWCLTETLRRQDASVVSTDLLLRFRALQQRLGIARYVSYLQSTRVTAPVLIGWIRPTVLVPASVITALPIFQLEALITHELAHIRRLDPFLNVVLIAAETILFYHPAVWWVTRRIRIDRENCCDDLSVALSGDGASYAAALISLNELRGNRAFGISSNGGKLRARIARLLGTAPEPARFSVSALFGVVLLCVAVGGIVAAQITPRFAIKIIDDTVAANSLVAPSGDDRVRSYETGKGIPSAFWLKRQGAIEGDVVSEAHVTTGPDGQPVIQFTLTPRAGDQFAALSRANVGRRAAVVVNGLVVASPAIKEPMLGGKAQISGNYTPAEANALASEMTGTASSAR